MSHTCALDLLLFGLALPVGETVVTGLAHFIICISDVDSVLSFLRNLILAIECEKETVCLRIVTRSLLD